MEHISSESDEQLVALYHQGQEPVMDYLMAKYKGLVIQKARKMFLFGGDQEDLIQEGMIGLMKAVRDYDESRGAAFVTFADLCVTRQMYSAIAAAKRQKHLPLNHYVSLYDEGGENGEEQRPPLIDTMVSDYETNPETLYIGQKNVENMIALINQRLSGLEQEVLQLHLQGYDYQKIAELLGRSPKTVDNTLQRVKNKAQKLL